MPPKKAAESKESNKIMPLNQESFLKMIHSFDPYVNNLNLSKFKSYLDDETFKIICQNSPNLTKLNISNCEKLTGKIFNSLVKLPLISLNISRNEDLPAEGLASIAEIASLQKVDISDCTFVNDKVLSELSKLHNLTKLDISGWNEITLEGVKNLKNLPLDYLSTEACNTLPLSLREKLTTSDEIANFFTEIEAWQKDNPEENFEVEKEEKQMEKNNPTQEKNNPTPDQSLKPSTSVPNPNAIALVTKKIQEATI